MLFILWVYFLFMSGIYDVKSRNHGCGTNWSPQGFQNDCPACAQPICSCGAVSQVWMTEVASMLMVEITTQLSIEARVQGDRLAHKEGGGFVVVVWRPRALDISSPGVASNDIIFVWVFGTGFALGLPSQRILVLKCAVDTYGYGTGIPPGLLPRGMLIPIRNLWAQTFHLAFCLVKYLFQNHLYAKMLYDLRIVLESHHAYFLLKVGGSGLRNSWLLVLCWGEDGCSVISVQQHEGGVWPSQPGSGTLRHSTINIWPQPRSPLHRQSLLRKTQRMQVGWCMPIVLFQLYIFLIRVHAYTNSDGASANLWQNRYLPIWWKCHINKDNVFILIVTHLVWAKLEVGP